MIPEVSDAKSETGILDYSIKSAFHARKSRFRNYEFGLMPEFFLKVMFSILN